MQTARTPREHLTKRIVDAAEPGDAERFVWDADLPGFGLRVTPQGAKAFVYQYRMRGEKNSRRYTIGRYGAWTPDTARDRCKELVRLVEAGEHPREAAEERARARERAKADAIERAFSAVADRWLRGYRHTKNGRLLSPKSVAMAKQVAKRLKDAFGDRPINEIGKVDLRDMLDAIPAENIATRRNAFAYARILWNWAEEHDLIATNPFDTLAAPGLPPARARVLDDDELALFWRATRKEEYPFGPLFRLLALTGQRVSEVRGMTWQELSKSRRTWNIAGDRTKNGKPQLVPLSSAAMAELQAIAPKDEWPKKGFVFTTNGEVPVAGLSKAKLRLDRQIALLVKEAKVDAPEPWRVHDLRRTLATGFQELGVRFEVTEAVLNHLSGARSGVAGVYQRHDWKAERREALDSWAKHLLGLTTPKIISGSDAAQGGSPP